MHLFSQNVLAPRTQSSTEPISNMKKIKNFTYSTSDKIGKGYSSIVYKGTNTDTNETVAIKCLNMKEVNRDTANREMLQCQIEALRTLKHDNILRCYDVVKETAYTYIITEFCNEGDLSAHLKKKVRLSENQTMKILNDIVSGFVEIGEKQFLHRDLKLANIFINNGRAKIADFGFAKKMRHSSERERYNVGSPLYMSPEALKKNIYSIKNDIWSIGIITYQLLHGDTPWNCRTEKQLMDKMVRIPVAFRESLNLSKDMKHFIKRCLQVDEKKRMSLQDMKEWHQNPQAFIKINNQNRQRATMPPKLSLNSTKPCSSIQTFNDGSQPLSQLTNRLTARTHRNNSINLNNKQNNKPITTSTSGNIILSKTIIDKNNTIIVNEINLYRLLYKILQKLRKYQPEQTELINFLGEEVLRRVISLKTYCVDSESQKSQYSLKEVQAYLCQSKNPSIRKYKSVITQYFKKYTADINNTTPLPKYKTLKEILSTYLKTRVTLMNPDQILMTYWMTQFIGLPCGIDLKKDYLDAIIEPKIKLNGQFVQQRIKDVTS